MPAGLKPRDRQSVVIAFALTRFWIGNQSWSGILQQPNHQILMIRLYSAGPYFQGHAEVTDQVDRQILI